MVAAMDVGQAQARKVSQRVRPRMADWLGRPTSPIISSSLSHGERHALDRDESAADGECRIKLRVRDADSRQPGGRGERRLNWNDTCLKRLRTTAGWIEGAAR